MGAGRNRLGEVPERTGTRAGKSALPWPLGNQKSMSPSSGPQVLARPRRPGILGKSRERPLPRPRGVVGYSQGCSGSWGGLGGQRSTRTRSPKALAAASDPPLCYLASRSRRGLRHKEVVVEGDSKSLKGGIHFGHLGRERREKGRGKKGRKKGRRGELDRGLAGVGRRREQQARLRASPSHSGV